MLCESCGEKPATYKATDIVNNVKSVKHLCEECYRESGLDSPFSKLNLASLISIQSNPEIEIKIIQPGEGEAMEPPSPGPVCECCGMDMDSFRSKGALGCCHDYDLFAEDIAELLLSLHGAREHRGKLPRDFQNQRARLHQANQLESELTRAVDDERYEDAARLRDRIRALSHSDKEGSSTDG